MTGTEYLKQVLDQQDLTSEEVAELKRCRTDVEDCLTNEFGRTPSIIYAGSMVKRTMVRESYDLDIVCRFPENSPETLKDLYERTYQSLAEAHVVQKKASAVRVLSLGSANEKPRDFHVDVVPVHLSDDKTGDGYIYQSSADRERLKTNLQTHVDSVRDSKLQDVIKLGKLWRVRNHFPMRTFVLEMLAVRFLEQPGDSLESDMIRFLTTCRDNLPTACLVDPANGANIVSNLMTDGEKELVSTHASQNLDDLERESEDEGRVRVWRSIMLDSLGSGVNNTVAAPQVVVRQPPKPWSID